MTVPAAASSAFYIRFAPGQVPDAQVLLDFLQQDTDTERIFRVTYRSRDDDWLELLSSGLTFELCGLSSALPMPVVETRYGLAEDMDLSAAGWLRLRPGDHLSGGRGQVPVVRVMAGLALGLLDLPGATGVVWEPARTLMSADHFRRILPGWLNGGAFPVLGLTALIRQESGVISTYGLYFFAGLELRIDPILAKQPGMAGKIALRLIHSLVEGWRVDGPVEVQGPDGEMLGVYPEEGGKILRVCRAG